MTTITGVITIIEFPDKKATMDGTRLLKSEGRGRSRQRAAFDFLKPFDGQTKTLEGDFIGTDFLFERIV